MLNFFKFIQAIKLRYNSQEGKINIKICMLGLVFIGLE